MAKKQLSQAEIHAIRHANNVKWEQTSLPDKLRDLSTTHIDDDVFLEVAADALEAKEAEIGRLRERGRVLVQKVAFLLGLLTGLLVMALKGWL